MYKSVVGSGFKTNWDTIIHSLNLKGKLGNDEVLNH